MSVTSSLRDIAPEAVADAIEIFAQSRSADQVASLLIENLDEFSEDTHFAPNLCTWDDISIIPAPCQHIACSVP